MSRFHPIGSPFSDYELNRNGDVRRISNHRHVRRFMHHAGKDQAINLQRDDGTHTTTTLRALLRRTFGGSNGCPRSPRKTSNVSCEAQT